MPGFRNESAVTFKVTQSDTLLGPCSFGQFLTGVSGCIHRLPSSTMHTYVLLTSLCSMWFVPSSVLSMQCKVTQYAWPLKAPHSCCDKCPPGKHMIWRSPTDCEMECGLCTGDRYADSSNVEMTCDVCRMCDKPNMEYESKCQTSRNAVCRCKAGYKCTDEACAQCLHIPGAVKSSATDAKGYLVEILPLCAVIAVTVFVLVFAFVRWIRSKHGYYSKDKRPALPPSTEEAEVCKPVQEMCGKCEQTLEV
ncbi:tumor necrosis factor receptor superfamily member 5 isoform X3 [Phyllopteryx taeniolatus]|uniref:tumor necrosis factor receptor superfamily member 5 isoform X3 n=1 Tax=Phyllopteryx taeniolatus TaxID=161469 RepID=UPI002AD581D2|nr:tumor necrosis factor receptor superfamily member 5 isoform X3 [Phyllopteryx taeniolatus]